MSQFFHVTEIIAIWIPIELPFEHDVIDFRYLRNFAKYEHTYKSKAAMAAPIEEQQPSASTSHTNGAATPAAGAAQAAPRKGMKEMTKGQSIH